MIVDKIYHKNNVYYVDRGKDDEISLFPQNNVPKNLLESAMAFERVKFIIAKKLTENLTDDSHLPIKSMEIKRLLTEDNTQKKVVISVFEKGEENLNLDLNAPAKPVNEIKSTPKVLNGYSNRVNKVILCKNLPEYNLSLHMSPVTVGGKEGHLFWTSEERKQVQFVPESSIPDEDLIKILYKIVGIADLFDETMEVDE